MGVQASESAYRPCWPVFFDTLNCSLLQIKSSKVSKIKDGEEKIASHVKSLNMAIRTVDIVIKDIWLFGFFWFFWLPLFLLPILLL